MWTHGKELEETDPVDRTEPSLGEGPTLLQRKRRPGAYAASGLEKNPEVTLMGLRLWCGVLLLPSVIGEGSGALGGHSWPGKGKKDPPEQARHSIVLQASTADCMERSLSKGGTSPGGLSTLCRHWSHIVGQLG